MTAMSNSNNSGRLKSRCHFFLTFCFPQVAEKRAKEEQVKLREETEAKLGVQVTALNENVATLKREWQGSQRRVTELEKQTDELRGEIAVLEATVQNNQDERRALLERSVDPVLMCNVLPMQVMAFSLSLLDVLETHHIAHRLLRSTKFVNV